MDEEKLKKIFRSIDIDGDGHLTQYEITTALEKAGQRPTPTEVKAMISLVDSNNSGTVEFHEFKVLYEKVEKGEIPGTTGLAKLIKSALEDHIKEMNKPVEKNQVAFKKGPSEFRDEAPEGEKWKLGKKKKGYVKPVAEKKTFDDLP